MELSVVVPTLNGREQLARTLDSVNAHVSEGEVIVVNGPSADGTTGMVRDREDVDVLVEIADRSTNAARNAGIDHATGDAIAFVNQGLSVTDDWATAIRTGLSETPIVTGPTHKRVRAGKTTECATSRTVAGRSITYVNPDNMVITRKLLADLDGFDEYLDVNDARDLSHRAAGMNRAVSWRSDMAVERPVGADGGTSETNWNREYRSLAYLLAKNYGFRPAVVASVCQQALSDASGGLRDVLAGKKSATDWFSSGQGVVTGIPVGFKDGLAARARDRSDRRNPGGRSTGRNRAVAVYDSR
ncbi:MULTISPECIES: glycosyltransferase family 2 protein [unclassified Halorhabdus]|uniref:glycosyltransferase family 2 protein n=1 Tax=unclassified Halorhabdus TaxID=2621901 RepID=UPI0023DC5194|nr:MULTISPECIES: glycosyltransferase family 2 protein [unclassified Halorhabdus]WEL17842.1 Glycosyl transferase family 2 [Halorhabdus sp. SVX81]WEL21718.1 Glycosyl transferase family 2 [Halorhabdus sp. BNX81]